MATITGRVVSPAGQSIGGTKVTLIRWLFWKRPSRDVTVGEDGAFRFERVGWGLRMLFAMPPSAGGLAPAFVRVGPVDDVVVTLSRATSIRGNVLDVQGRPKVGGSVSAIQPPHDQRHGCFGTGVTVAADGSFEIPHVPPGPVRVQYHPDPATSEATAEAVLDDSPTAPIVLRCTR